MRTDEVVAKTHFTDEVLLSTIMVEGKSVTVGEASAEGFDMYIYSILYQMYKKKGHAHNRYEQSFWEYDFNTPLARVFALNKLYKLNQLRAGPPAYRPEVPLFAEEPA